MSNVILDTQIMSHASFGYMTGPGRSLKLVLPSWWCCMFFVWQRYNLSKWWVCREEFNLNIWYDMRNAHLSTTLQVHHEYQTATGHPIHPTCLSSSILQSTLHVYHHQLFQPPYIYIIINSPIHPTCISPLTIPTPYIYIIIARYQLHFVFPNINSMFVIVLFFHTR